MVNTNLSCIPEHVYHSSFGFVIPFFENIEFLRRQVNAVRNQTHREWRLVIVDDSIDQVLNKDVGGLFLDERIELLSNGANLGIGKSWNRGVDYLVSRHHPKVVSVIHGDDELHPDFALVSISVHEQFPSVYAVHTEVEIIGPNSQKVFSLADKVKFLLRPRGRAGLIFTKGDAGLADILKGNFIFCPSLSFKTSKLVNPVFDQRWEMVLDLDLICRALLVGETLIGVRRRLYRYRRHSQSQTSRLTASLIRFEEEVSLYVELHRRCKNNGFTESARIAKQMRIIFLHLGYLLFKSLARFEFASSRRQWVLVRQLVFQSRSL